MTTKKPRIQVTLEQSDYDLVSKLASLQARSISSVVAELIAACAPSFDLTIKMLFASSQISGVAREHWLSSVEADERFLGLKVSEVFQNALDELDNFSSNIINNTAVPAHEERERVSTRSKAGKEEGIPPYSNRGVRSTKAHRKNVSGKIPNSLIKKVIDNTGNSD